MYFFSLIPWCIPVYWVGACDRGWPRCQLNAVVWTSLTQQLGRMLFFYHLLLTKQSHSFLIPQHTYQWNTIVSYMDGWMDLGIRSYFQPCMHLYSVFCYCIIYVMIYLKHHLAHCSKSPHSLRCPSADILVTREEPRADMNSKQTLTAEWTT